MYSIKEIYFTLQGEGYHTGRPAVFCRFSGCNLWTGLEKDRSTAICQFCDTDFWGIDGENGGKYHSKSLANLIENQWQGDSEPFVVFTGGEPLLQLDKELIDEVHRKGFQIAVETNGTILPPDNIDWICVSPKANSKLVLEIGNELKLVYPQKNFDPSKFESFQFDHFFLQPMDGMEVEKSTLECVNYCIKNPKWKLSLQTHKLMGIK